MSASPRRTQLFNQPQQTTNTNHVRSYSPPPQQIQPSLSRQTSEISLYDQNSSPLDNMDNSDIKQPWTRKQWEALELWYDKLDRDYQRAATAFYIHESAVSETNPPLWSKDYILWRCQCLDTNTKYHHGILPSERKRRKDLLKNKKKQDLLKRQRSTQQLERKDLEQVNYRKYNNLTTKTADIVDDTTDYNNSTRIRNITAHTLE